MSYVHFQNMKATLLCVLHAAAAAMGASTENVPPVACPISPAAMACNGMQCHPRRQPPQTKTGLHIVAPRGFHALSRLVLRPT